MKTGVEIIAEKQSEMAGVLAENWVWELEHLVMRANMTIVFQTRPSQKDEAIRLLAEAGAYIAIQIDKLNELKQE